MSCRSERERLFFALFPTARVRRAIAAIQEQFDFEARPVRADQFHITLVFLGDQPVARRDELRKLATAVMVPECAIRLDRVGCFTQSGVAYLGASEPPCELRAFRHKLVERLDEAGFTADPKPWQPHVTLYRKMRKPCARMPLEPVDWPITTYCLVSSRLENSGPVYRVLERWKSAG